LPPLVVTGALLPPELPGIWGCPPYGPAVDDGTTFWAAGFDIFGTRYMQFQYRKKWSNAPGEGV
jgi:hypothetical protein